MKPELLEQFRTALFTSFEGYVAAVVDSMEFSLGRELTREEFIEVSETMESQSEVHKPGKEPA